MKYSNTIIALLAVAISFTSCMQKETAQFAEAASTEISIRASIANVSASVKSDDVFTLKNTWSSEDFISVFNYSAQSMFRAASNGSNVEFFSLSADNSALQNSTVYATYPAVKKNSFSLKGQNGSAASAGAHTLMVAEGTVSNNTATLSFEHTTSVLRISNVSIDNYRGGSFNKMVISGNGIAEELSVVLGSNGLEIAPASASDITVFNPDFTNDVYVAFAPTAETTSLTIAVYDTTGGEFFYTLEANFQSGKIYNVENVSFQGGYAITFAPEVENWNNTNC